MDTTGRDGSVEPAKLHMYRNRVVEWYSATTLDEAVELARQYKLDVCGCDESELDLGLVQEPDDKPLTLDDDGLKTTRTAAEWARRNGKGFWGSTEY